MNKAKVISTDGTVATSEIHDFGKKEGVKVTNLKIMVPEQIYETEENVSVVPAKSICLSGYEASELYKFLKETFQELEKWEV